MWVKKYTPLHYAANNGHLRIVEHLINQKADINALDRFGRTPLRFAIENEKFSVVEFLKSKGGQ